LAKLWLNPSSINWGAEHSVGDVFEVQVRVADAADCYAVQFGVAWDANILECVEAVKGDFLEEAGVSTWWFPYSEVGLVTCAYMRFQATSGVNVSAADGLVAKLKFKTLKQGATDITFIPQNCAWFNSAWQEGVFTELQSVRFTFGVPVGYPKMTIINVSAPVQASEGEVFEVKVDWRNNGQWGKAYTRIIDLETGIEVLPRTEFNVATNQQGTNKYSIKMGNKSLRLRFELGHIE
jgi:hypothetical protein